MVLPRSQTRVESFTVYNPEQQVFGVDPDKYAAVAGRTPSSRELEIVATTLSDMVRWDGRSPQEVSQLQLPTDVLRGRSLAPSDFYRAALGVSTTADPRTREAIREEPVRRPTRDVSLPAADRARGYGIVTSITLEYRTRGWGIERLVLDTVANHLPDDSGGAELKVLLKQKGEYRDIARYDPKLPVEEIVVEDDGTGYSSDFLGVLFSTKDPSKKSVGQFGEGLKLASAVALRESHELTFMSEDWTATPYAEDIKVGPYSTKRVCFRMQRAHKSITGSKTVFHKPNDKLLQEFLKLPAKVLALNNTYRELFVEPNTDPDRCESRIIDLGEDSETKGLFVKGIIMQREKSIWNYDMNIENISPDREIAHRRDVLDAVERLLLDCDEPEVIKRLLAESANGKKGTLETEALSPGRYRWDDKQKKRHEQGPLKEHWEAAFRGVFGQDAVLAQTGAGTGANAHAAQMGYRVIELQYDLHSYLEQLGIGEKAGEVLVSEDTRNRNFIPLDRLNPQETAWLQVLTADVVASGFLGKKQLPEIRVYVGKTPEGAKGKNLGIHTSRGILLERDFFKQRSEWMIAAFYDLHGYHAEALLGYGASGRLMRQRFLDGRIAHILSQMGQQ